MYHLSNRFHQKTKIKKIIPATDSSTWPENWKEIHYKQYPRLPHYYLSTSFSSISMSFKNILINRHSERKFCNKSVSIKKLSTLLYYSAGIPKVMGLSNLDTHRFYPSAGARYPIELYVASQTTEKIPKGLYHYNLKQHSLEYLFSDNKVISTCNKFIQQPWIEASSVLIILSAVFDRSRVKYNDRAYRYIFMEAGHLGQNINFVANSLKLKCCAIGGFNDDKFNKLLDLDDTQEAVLYIFAIGN